MKFISFIIFFYINVSQAQNTDPFGDNFDFNKQPSKSYTICECKEKVIYLGADNKLQLPSKYLGESEISIKVKNGTIKSKLDNNYFFSWQICDTTIDSSKLFIYKKGKLVQEIIYEINQNQNIIRPEFYRPSCLKTTMTRNDNKLSYSLYDTSLHCTHPFWVDFNNISTVSFNIIIFNEKGDKDSIVLKNYGDIISSNFFDIYENTRGIGKKNPILFCNFKVFNECTNKEYYLKETMMFR
jgi:hypothetical protein